MINLALFGKSLPSLKLNFLLITNKPGISDVISPALFDTNLPNLEVNFLLVVSFTLGITTVIKIRLFGKSLEVLELTYSN